MNKLTTAYSRIIISEYLELIDSSKEIEEKISEGLEELYDGYLYDTNLKNYINKKINYTCNQSSSNRSEIRLRSSKENNDKFVSLYKNLYNFLFLKSREVRFSCKDLEDLVLGYIHLCNINFQDEILGNLDYTLQGSIFRFYLYNEDTKEEIFNQETNGGGSVIYKITSLKKGRKVEKFAIPFKKTSPYEMIKIAVYDSEVMFKTHHLFLEKDIFYKLSQVQQDIVKKFVEERKKEHHLIFGESKDGVFPLISKDVVGLINEMVYPELDLDKQVKKILKDCEDEFSNFENIIDNYGDGNLEKDALTFKGLIVNNICFFLNSMDKVKELKTKPTELRQELLLVSSYIWKLLKLDVVRCFTNLHQKFHDTVKNKREELKRDVGIWKQEGEDVDWFLELLKE